MNYTEFQTYFTRKMWRTGDTDWDTDLPQLINKAEARIRRDLQYQPLLKSQDFVITEDEFDIPADFKEAASVYLEGSPGAGAKALSIGQFRVIQNQFNSGSTGFKGMYFCPFGMKMLVLTGATVDTPQTVKLDYYMGLVPYATDPAIPFYDLHPDFYEAALNVQAYEYLRDFELSGEYNNSYIDLLNGMRADSEYLERPSGMMPTIVPGNVR